MLYSLFNETLQFTPDQHVLVLNSAADPFIPQLARQVNELVLAEDSVAALSQALTGIKQASRAHVRNYPYHEYILQAAPATMDVALLNILYQPNNPWMYYGLHLAAYALKPGGKLYVTGAKDRGILSLGKRIQSLFGNLETLKISKGMRLICATKTTRTKIELVAPATDDAGPITPFAGMAPFADGQLDEGTALLLEALDVRTTDVALDLGCGNGYIGTYIAERANKGQVVMVDASRASVDAARRLSTERGLTNAECLASDAARAVSTRRFDLIATNPPFHIGGIQTTAVAERFIKEASQLLRFGGRFYLVANRFLKYEPMMMEHFGNVEEISGNTRYKVLRAQKNKTIEEPEEEILYSIL
jgi:16S rRNA (guanine1207-N2)-methyltransferase